MVADDILSILEDKLRLGSRNDDNVSVHCPFHSGGEEATPSMYLYIGPRTACKSPGMAYCHACGRGWTLKSLARGLGLDPRILKLIDEDVRVELSEYSKYLSLSFDHPILPESVLAPFRYIPRELERKGFTIEILKEYDIGYDRTQRRIIFPIRDHLGNLVGISGRATSPDDVPRYKIYRRELEPVCPGYNLNKNTIVWGLDKFYVESMLGYSTNPVVVCEGFKAALWVRLSGYKNAVCILGNRCSKEQAHLISRVADKVVLALDNDKGGMQGMGVSLKNLSSYVSVSALQYDQASSGLSPDDIPLDKLKSLLDLTTTGRAT